MIVEDFKTLKVGDKVMYGGEANIVTETLTNTYVKLKDNEGYECKIYIDEDSKIEILGLVEPNREEKVFEAICKREKEDKRNVKYILYQVKHGVPLDDVLRNLGYVKR